MTLNAADDSGYLQGSACFVSVVYLDVEGVKPLDLDAACQVASEDSLDITKACRLGACQSAARSG